MAPASATTGPAAPCDIGVLPTSERTADYEGRANPAFDRMHVERAQQVSRGRGVTVAVVDSGVRPDIGIPVVGSRPNPGLKAELLSGHGTIAAGLVAGPDGVAPGAGILDVRVLDTELPDAEEGQRGVTSGGIAQGLDAIADGLGQTPVDVVSISLAVFGDDPALRASVKRLQRLGVVVVAAAGNRPAEDAPDAVPSEGTPDNDAAVFPADYPGVIAVSATPPAGEDPAAYVLPNADTDVSAPTDGAVSLNLTGQRCRVTGTATSWATAEVSGVVAMLRARFPRETPRQIAARLTRTAEGSDADGGRAPFAGAGVVQAFDALTRLVDPDRRGETLRSQAVPDPDAQAPPAPSRPDLFGPSRRNLLWFGTGAVSLLVLATLLRPLLRRR